MSASVPETGETPKCKAITVTIDYEYDGMEDQTIKIEMDPNGMFHHTEHRSVLPVYEERDPNKVATLLPAPETYVVIHGVTKRETP
jgi:hypothetical protein